MTGFAACPNDRDQAGLGRALGAAIVRALLWPARVMTARATLAQLAGLSESRIRQITQ